MYTGRYPHILSHHAPQTIDKRDTPQPDHTKQAVGANCHQANVVMVSGVANAVEELASGDPICVTANVECANM